MASFFCVFMVVVHKHEKKKGLGQYPAILTSRPVNNPYVVFCFETQRSKEVLPDVYCNNFPPFAAQQVECFSVSSIHDVMSLQLAAFCILKRKQKTAVFLNIRILK